ncbi:site-specific integrase [Geoalkalibacter halelectricus]|uniref:site-specific integrase n=1 Tax=Geoalkalibacter halelectricus TaxID=2847045 RepID=UPI00266F3ED5|nr:site-specific integrase [Geoalkalibacter halelectricus]MDO3380489.1 site-specific integrase [Geoalkalibacter halelectricus]
MLEYWYKERRTLADFRRGPLGPYMDGLAARLQERAYSRSFAVRVLGNCCLFNSFLIDQRIKRGKEITLAHFESFIDAYLADFKTASKRYVGRGYVWGSLKHLLSYLVDICVMKPLAPKPLPPQYRWVLEPYLYHLQEERQLKANTIQNYRQALCRFLDGLGERTTRKGMKALKAENLEDYITQHIKESPENLRNLVGYLKGFLRFCALRGMSSRIFPVLSPPYLPIAWHLCPKGWKTQTCSEP